MDGLPDFLCSDIVYSYSCPDCGVRYNGPAYRNLRLMISEHKGFLSWINRPLVSSSFSVIRSSTEEDHRVWDSGFRITFRARQMSDVRIAELLCIFQDKPELNINESGVKLHTIN